jgi:Uma2 family endonuclease
MTRVAKLPDRDRVQMTYDEFLRREGDNAHVEWVDGELVMMAPISNEHDDVAGLLYSLLRSFVEVHGLGVVKHDPFQMKTGPRLPGRAPDIQFLARKNLGRLKKTHVQGPADLVVEVISPGSRGVDRGDKFYEYEKGGVREYWLLDPDRKQAEFYGLDRDGIYKPMPIDDGVFRSVVAKGVWLRVAWLWQRPLPLLVELQKELGLV